MAGPDNTGLIGGMANMMSALQNVAKAIGQLNQTVGGLILSTINTWTALQNFSGGITVTGTTTLGGALVETGYSYQAPLTGFSITIANGIQTLLLDPAGTLATGTITMPSAPADGQVVEVTSSQTITSLTVSANTGQSIKNAPTALTVSTTGSMGYKFKYRGANTTWYRLQ